MRANPEAQTRSRATRPLLTAALTFAIFVCDTLTDLEIAFPVFYIAVVLLSVTFLKRRGVIAASLVCMFLTILSFFLTRNGAVQAGVFNIVISLLAIATSTYLILKIESAEVAAHDARAQLAHLARLTTLGELAASIAHEVNQPLAAIVTSGSACLRWLKCQPPNLEKAEQAIDRIVSDANRASDVIGRVRKLVKREPAAMNWFDLNETILEVLALTRDEIASNRIGLLTELAPDLPRTWGDRVQIQQVLLNLIINAIEALAECPEGLRQIRVSARRNGGGEAIVAVGDSGLGPKADALDSLFDAFYTTKSEGIGMGLTISRTIVEAHGGHIRATLIEPRGVVFEFGLRLEEREAE